MVVILLYIHTLCDGSSIRKRGISWLVLVVVVLEYMVVVVKAHRTRGTYLNILCGTLYW